MIKLGFQETFKALADPVRREILTMLREKKLSAGEISSKFDMTSATISYHLSILKKADLIKEEKRKNFIYYELNTSVVEEIILWLNDIKQVDTQEDVQGRNIQGRDIQERNIQEIDIQEIDIQERDV